MDKLSDLLGDAKRKGQELWDAGARSVAGLRDLARTAPGEYREMQQGLDEILNPPGKPLAPPPSVWPTRYEVEANIRQVLADLIGMWRGRYTGPRKDSK